MKYTTELLIGDKDFEVEYEYSFEPNYGIDDVEIIGVYIYRTINDRIHRINIVNEILSAIGFDAETRLNETLLNDKAEERYDKNTY